MSSRSVDRREAYVISHTHWDREWYCTFHEFRTDLVYVVREVLDRLEDETAFRHFLLDGQAIIVEDYLTIHPEDTARLRQLVERGKLAIGPWYVLPDEFLVSGEATVRNLLVGHAVGNAFGGVQKVGYLPDSFGHIAQMPQILRQVGIDSFVYTRGNGDEIEHLGYQYTWVGPDGSEVLAINQCGGYCKAGGLGLEQGWYAQTQRRVDPTLAVSQVRAFFEQVAPGTSGNVYLISNGCDHYPPQRELGAILEALREAFPDTGFRHSSLSAYLERFKSQSLPLGRHAGELIGGKDQFILQGVWSARMYLKQQNERGQTMLAGVLEPMSAYTHFMHGRPYPTGLVDYAWKLLLQNHPHDSICGCSIDSVHREMLPRFAGVLETADRELRRQMASLAPAFAREAADDREMLVCVANPLASRRSEVVERLLVFDPPGPDIDRLRVIDASGRPVEHEVVDCWFVQRFWDVDYRTELFGETQADIVAAYAAQFPERISRDATRRETADCFVMLRVLANDLPPVGHAIYRIVETTTGQTEPETTRTLAVGEDTLENDFVKVRLHGDGTFDVLDKRSGRRYERLNRLTDREDIGDEYDYAPAPTSTTVTSHGIEGQVQTVRRSRLVGSIEARFSFRIPDSITPDRERRTTEQTDCAVRVRVTLALESPVVEVELEFDNRAKDHRLRAEFPTGVIADHVVSEGHFYVNQRSIAQPSGATWVQPPAGTSPQQGFSLVEDGEHGLAILNRGLPEIEATTEADGGVVLALTLLRSVGWLSRDDFDTRRRRSAGPMLPTPDAQCLGEHRFYYAVVPFEGSYLEAGITELSQRFRTPVIAVQGVADQHMPGGAGLVEQASGNTCVTAVKKHATRDTLVVRLYNLTAEPVVETLTFGRQVKASWRVNLLEERQGTLEVRERSMDLTLTPHEILTIEVAFGKEEA